MYLLSSLKVVDPDPTAVEAAHAQGAEPPPQLLEGFLSFNLDETTYAGSATVAVPKWQRMQFQQKLGGPGVETNKRPPSQMMRRMSLASLPPIDQTLTEESQYNPDYKRSMVLAPREEKADKRKGMRRT